MNGVGLMFLSKCLINGFKSFADKVEIDFQKGFSAIVGPNGCGKSNIYEAILWVLGEQRPTSLRSSKMEEVIFSGTSTRSPVGMAEVTVIITDEEYILSDRSELKITRRLFRSGESEYYLNGQQCRLKDITQLLSKVGLGKNSYAFIGQGEVNDILKAKPKDLRLMFEESAGIADYKTQKFSTEAQLQKTQESILRVDDLIKEIEIDCERLRERAKQAKEHQSVYEKLQAIRELFLRSQYHYYKNNIKEKTRSIEINQQKVVDSEIIISKLEAEETSLKSKRVELENQSRNFDREIVRNESRSVSLRERESEIVEEIEHYQSRYTVKETEKNKEEQALASLKQEYQSKLEKRNDLSFKIDRAYEEIDNYNKLMKTYFQKVDQELYEKLESQYQSSKIEIASLNERKISLQNELARLIKNIEEEETKIAKDVELKNNLLADLSQEESKLEELISKSAKQKDLKNELEKQLREIEDVYKPLLSKSDQLLQEYRLNKNKLEFYNKQSAAYSGYYNGVRHLMLEKTNSPQKYSGLIGPIAELIRIDEEYQRAIGEVLGSKSQYLVCQRAKDAANYIEELKNNRAGKATFLPLDSARTLQSNIPQALIENSKYIGRASALISYEQEIESAITHLLGNVLVFEDAQSVLKLSKNHKRNFLIVTLDGEIFFSSGIISGGKNKGNNNQDLIEREAIIEELELLTNKQKDSLEFNKNKLTDLKLRAKNIDKEKEEVITKLQSILNEINSIKQHISINNVKLTNIVDHIEEIEQGNIERLHNKERINTQILDIDESISSKESGLIEIEEALCTQRKSIEELSSIKEKLSNAKSDLLLFNNSLDNIEANLETLEENIDKTKEREAVILAEVERYKQVLSEKKSNLNDIRANISDIEMKINSLYEEKNILDKKIANINSSIESSFCQRRDLINAIDHSKTKLKELELELVTLKTDLKYTDAQIYQYDIKIKDEEKVEVLKVDLQKLQSKLNELDKEHKKLGNIDYGAIEDLARKEERLEFLSEQKEDLEETQKKLTKIIKDVDNICITKLGETIDKVRSNFKVVFQDLFQGGSADIIWELEESIFDSGVSLRVSPPGKNVTNMNQLSGGEKALTAIALLLAFAKLRRSAFCIFDEVDAALDENNNLLLVDYLQEISKSSQVLTITHSRHTMAHANHLYGVVMQEKGVSKVINVEMDN